MPDKPPYFVLFRTIHGFIAENVPGTLLIFYYSGHGMASTPRMASIESRKLPLLFRNFYAKYRPLPVVPMKVMFRATKANG